MSKNPKPIVLFEDDATLTLEPLSLTRPVWELRCGIRTLDQKILAAFPDAEVFSYARPYLEKIIDNPYIAGKSDKQDLLWVNGSFIPNQEFSRINDLEEGSAWVRDGRVIAFRGFPPEGWKAGTHLPGDGFHKVDPPRNAGKLIRYLWELVNTMNVEITGEAHNLLLLGDIKGDMHRTVILIDESEIAIADCCTVAPGVVIDASSGPVVLDENVFIGANSVIEGPTYLGKGTEVKPLAHIRGSCLGEQCRVGGEISVSILQGFSNKQHGGFLGHSYIGSWCNLGSGTETSNLKNNYTPVKVQVGSKLVDTGQLFAGLFMGDHSKSAIGSVFNTGTVVGVGSMVFGAGFSPRFVPSFHWGGSEKLTLYPLGPTMETAREMMSRRNQEMTEAEMEILQWIRKNRTGSSKICQ